MTTTRRRVPWELIGLLIVVAVFAVAAVLWFASPRGRGELQAPDFHTLGEPPLPHGVTEDGRPYVGTAGAPVTVIEIADFQCPFCREFATSDFEAIAETYVADGTAQWILYLVGFDGEESTAAAVAAQCAARQDAFWAMHDWLYANTPVVINSGAYSPERLSAMAQEIGLDIAAFDACRADPEVEALILENEAYARSLGVTASPTFVIGDRLVEGRDVTALRALLEAAARE